MREESTLQWASLNDSHLFQYTKKLAICVKCWEIHSRALGSDFQLAEFSQGYGDHGMGAKHLKIEENHENCTEHVLQLKANLYAMPCPARCCWHRFPVNAPAWAESGSQEDHLWWRLYQWCAWSCRGPWDACPDGIMTLESSVPLASLEGCQWSSPHNVNPRSFHRYDDTYEKTIAIRNSSLSDPATSEVSIMGTKRDSPWEGKVIQIWVDILLSRCIMLRTMRMWRQDIRKQNGRGRWGLGYAYTLQISWV